jgi:cobalt/nickel transport system permease protein
VAGQLSLRDFLQLEMSQFDGEGHGWRLWDARLKILISIAAMALNVLFARAWLSAALLALAALGMIYSQFRFRHVLLFLLAPGWATLTLVIGMAFGFGQTELFHFGSLVFYREGLQMGLNAGLRVAADVAWAGLLMISTPFPAMLAALRSFGIPRVITDTLSGMYRYVFLLYDEFGAMKNAARSRGGFSSFRSSMASSGQIAAQIFLRSYDRAGRVWQAMQARGGER